MLENFFDLDYATNFFRQIDGLGNSNCILYATNENKLELKTIAALSLLGAVKSNFGISSLYSDIRLGQAFSNLNCYILNKTENGIGIIEFSKDENENQIPTSYLNINQSDIKNISLVQNGYPVVDTSLWVLTIELNNDEKLKFYVHDTDDNINYQEENFKNLMVSLGVTKDLDLVNKKNKIKKAGIIFGIVFMIAFIALLVIVVKLCMPNGDSNTSNSNSNKIHVDIYKP